MLLIIVPGYILLIIPGVILYLMLSQYQYVIVDRNARITESLSLSREIMVGNKGTLFAVNLVAGLVGTVFVVFTCCVGVILLIPYMATLQAVFYLAATGQATADMRWGAPAPPHASAAGASPFAPPHGAPPSTPL